MQHFIGIRSQHHIYRKPWQYEIRIYENTIDSYFNRPAISYIGTTTYRPSSTRGTDSEVMNYLADNQHIAPCYTWYYNEHEQSDFYIQVF
jgi:hypothetical protein